MHTRVHTRARTHTHKHTHTHTHTHTAGGSGNTTPGAPEGATTPVAPEQEAGARVSCVTSYSAAAGLQTPTPATHVTHAMHAGQDAGNCA